MSFYHLFKSLIARAFFTLAITLACFSLTAKAQEEPKTSFFLTDSKEESPVARWKRLRAASPILKLIDKAAEESPLAFVWQLNADTLVKEKDLFRELIEFDGGGATFRRSTVIDTVRLKKSSAADYNVLRNFYTYSGSLASYDISQQKGKPMLVFLNPKSNEKLYFKVFLDKAGKKILKIQNVSSKRFYLPTAFEGPTISM